MREGESAVTGYETMRLTRDGSGSLTSRRVIAPVRMSAATSSPFQPSPGTLPRSARPERPCVSRDRALAATTNGILIIDATAPEGPIVDVNHALELLTGYTRDEAIGNSARMLYGPGHRSGQRTEHPQRNPVREEMYRDLADLTAWTGHPSGVTTASPRSVILQATPTHFVGVLTDVSKRKGRGSAGRGTGPAADAAGTSPRTRSTSRTVGLPAFCGGSTQATARELGIATVAEAIGKTDRDFFPETLAEEYDFPMSSACWRLGNPWVSKLSERQHRERRWPLGAGHQGAYREDAQGSIVGLRRDQP